MKYSNLFYKAFQIETDKEIKTLSKNSGVSIASIRDYCDNLILPSGKDLKKICEALDITSLELKLKTGVLNCEIFKKISENAEAILEIIADKNDKTPSSSKKKKVVLKTEKGVLYNEDCIELMKTMGDEEVDLIFADPPFNLKKIYPSEIDDNLKKETYLSWSEEWMEECIRILKPGGSFFIYNLPKWNTGFSDFLNKRLNFRNWIAIEIKQGLPIKSKLYPSHYSLIYYTKGKRPETFKPDRLPMQVCSSCFKEIRDYGGYKNKMNPLGINLGDVWTDIPPVRHSKYKRRKGANELSIKLLDRIIEMASKEGDVVFDPFGGSGTTYIVSEIKNRKWIGTEIGPVKDITERFKIIEEEKANLESSRSDYNQLFPVKIKNKRKRNKLWICEDFNS